MKVVINKCFGGFSISNKAVERLAELNGKKAYFFEQDGYRGVYRTASAESNSFITYAFDVSNPNDYDTEDKKETLWREHYLTNRPEDRSDPKLIQVVEELGEEANGPCAELRIIEIPDGINWEVSEYDGMESVEEVHRSWG